MRGGRIELISPSNASPQAYQKTNKRKGYMKEIYRKVKTLHFIMNKRYLPERGVKFNRQGNGEDLKHF